MYIYFWSEKNPKTGYLSNWYNSPMVIDGIQFCNVEQYMMYMKAIIFNDRAIAQQILNTSNPKEIKALGRKVRNYDDVTWANMRRDIVYKGVYEKMMQNPDIHNKLIQTPIDTIFVEASPYDKIWGVGLSANDPLIKSESTWQGLNLLGGIWTEIRRSI